MYSDFGRHSKFHLALIGTCFLNSFVFVTTVQRYQLQIAGRKATTNPLGPSPGICLLLKGIMKESKAGRNVTTNPLGPSPGICLLLKGIMTKRKAATADPLGLCPEIVYISSSSSES